MKRRLLAMMMAVVLLVAAIPWAAAAEEDALLSTVEKQVRAFADSIDQPNADDEAAWAIAGHGISGRGKELKVSSSHVLSAALMNSELMQKTVITGCTAMARMIQEMGLDVLHGKGHVVWASEGYRYGGLYAYSSYNLAHTDRLGHLIPGAKYSGSKNDYDQSLEWIAGNTLLEFHMDRTAVTVDAVTYAVELVVRDRFDFDASASSNIPAAILSMLGSFLFKEFDWRATITFSLTVPNSCSHETGHSRWIYDESEERLVCDGTDNGLTQLSSPYNGSTNNYYRLNETAVLYHDRPWVLEYEVINPKTIAFMPVNAQVSAYPYLMNVNRNRLSVWQYENVLLTESEMKKYGVDSAKQHILHEYGTPLSSLFSYSSSQRYRVRVENQVNPDGSNMLWLTVCDMTKNALVLDRVPLDDHWMKENWNEERAKVSTEDNYLNGVDLTINYIGSYFYNVDAGLKSVEIWVNGEHGGDISYLTDRVVQASCTEGGYTDHSCSRCGAKFRDGETPAKGHSFGEWVVTEEPTYQKPGEQNRSCNDCGHTERVEMPKLEPLHGDATCDGIINGKDLVILRQYLAGWTVEAHANGSDVNGDGTINGKDLILLRQYLAGWDVELG